ncbi:MAG TPA: adenylate/guanylate cyclase domain-containing protein [Gemmataceae bacterium]|nr:adenylate/guanylate cyclase domain-containing protein [Gemmataceae bacterium]
MAKLIATGLVSGKKWQKSLPENQCLTLGRDAQLWAVPWDAFISRQHAELIWRDGRLEVRRLANACNPIFCNGEEVTQLRLKPGESFVIGQTRFTLANDPDQQPVLAERSVSAQELQSLPFRNASYRLDVLSRLPDVIAGASDERDLSERVVNMLLAGIPAAQAIALVAIESPAQEESMVRVLHKESRLVLGEDFQPSERLIRVAVRRQETVLHVWGQDAAPADSGLLELTQAGNEDWAFCTPVRGERRGNWAIYVTGRLTQETAATVRSPWEDNALGDDFKFTELVAAILGSLRQVQRLQRDQASLRHFFSPAVIRTLSDNDPDVVLKPREEEVTVLFCDLRGFSKIAAEASDLMGLLERISKALSVMTQNILDQGGVVGDFHGDAAMGFWGWPLTQPDGVKRACMAALGIRTQFEINARRPDHPLAAFRAGIGIGTGRAVAGKIGAIDQVKITVFGPIVNLASRLEGMTKIFRAPILMDEKTAQLAKEQVPPSLARQRRLAKALPLGLKEPLVISELLPPLLEYPLLTDAHVADYEAAVDAFMAGDWCKTLELFNRVPAEDRCKDYLMMFIAENDRTPPPGWDGVLVMKSKT